MRPKKVLNLIQPVEVVLSPYSHIPKGTVGNAKWNKELQIFEVEIVVSTPMAGQNYFTGDKSPKTTTFAFRAEQLKLSELTSESEAINRS